MPPLRLLKPSQVIRAFQLGWQVARQRGSHIILTKSGNAATLSVPNHDHVARGTLRALIGRAGMAVDDFVAAVDE